MILKHRRRTSSTPSGHSTKKTSSRITREKDFAIAQSIAQVFFLLLGFAVFAAVCLYTSHFSLTLTNRKGIEQAKAEIDRLRWQQNPDLGKGREMLIRQHQAGINLLNAMRSDNQLLVLQDFWNKIPETERSLRFEDTRNTLLAEPGLRPILRSQGHGLTDFIVPELFAEEVFARDPDRLMHTVKLLLQGQENGLSSSAERHKLVDSDSTRSLYRSAILSRFIATFLLDLSAAVAAKSPQQGIGRVFFKGK